MLGALALTLTCALTCACEGDPHAPHDASTASTHDTLEWRLLTDSLPAALLAVTASDAGLFVVGADPGTGPLVMRYAGGSWQTLATGERGALWWVTQAPDGALWMVGEAGLVLRHEPASTEFERVSVPTAMTLYGIWFAPDGTGYIVGGDANDEQAEERGVLLRLRDGAWERDTDFAAELSAEHVLFKVWGRGNDELWIVGDRGLVAHRRDAEAFVVESVARERFVTVHGGPTLGPVVVGGFNNATLLRHEGDVLHDEGLELDDGFAPALNGAFVTDEQMLVVGNFGFSALRGRDDAAWRWAAEPATRLHLHAVTVDADGRVFAVGGDLLASTLDRGTLLCSRCDGVAAPER